MFIYLFWERVLVCVCESGGGAESENLKQARCSVHCRAQGGAWTHELWDRDLSWNQVGHLTDWATQAPRGESTLSARRRMGTITTTITITCISIIKCAYFQPRLENMSFLRCLSPPMVMLLISCTMNTGLSPEQVSENIWVSVYGRLAPLLSLMKAGVSNKC